jgi:hypothetical protein
MNRWRARIVQLLTVSGLFLYALPSPSLTYGAIVLLHVVLGFLFFFWLLPLLARLERTERLGSWYAWALLACGAILGLALIYLGAPHRLRGWLYAQIFLCAAGVLLLAASWMASRGWLGKGAGGHLLRFALLLVVAASVAGGAWFPFDIEPDIHLLSRANEWSSQKIELVSLPVSKQFDGGIGNLRSVAQSATDETWQAAR